MRTETAGHNHGEGVNSASETVSSIVCCFEPRLAHQLDGGVYAPTGKMRKDSVKKDLLRTLGIRLLRIPNAMVLEHTDEFVGAVAEKARK
jgi:very-short-patch-repair endonuclease